VNSSSIRWLPWAWYRNSQFISVRVRMVSSTGRSGRDADFPADMLCAILFYLFFFSIYFLMTGVSLSKKKDRGNCYRFFWHLIKLSYEFFHVCHCVVLSHIPVNIERVRTNKVVSAGRHPCGAIGVPPIWRVSGKIELACRVPGTPSQSRDFGVGCKVAIKGHVPKLGIHRHPRVNGFLNR
jgi:hypothetical protein